MSQNIKNLLYHQLTNSTIRMYSSYLNSQGNYTEATSELYEEISNITLDDQPLPSLEMAHVTASLAIIIIIIGELIQVCILRMIIQEDVYLKRITPGENVRGSVVKGRFK